jgi:glycerophosphoryl diester phosphodiesterase
VHETGLLLGTWIVDEPERARVLLLAGVDAVATNRPRAIDAACRDLLAS